MRKELKELLKHKKWYDVEKILPIDETDCLVTNGKDVGYIHFSGGPTLYAKRKPFGKITHWMPLPHPPHKNSQLSEVV